MEDRPPATGNTSAHGPATSGGGTAAEPSGTARSRVRLAFTVLAGVLAVAGVVSLGALLLEALRGEAVWPGFAAGSFYTLPAAFVLLAGLVIDSIVHRRRS